MGLLRWSIFILASATANAQAPFSPPFGFFGGHASSPQLFGSIVSGTANICFDSSVNSILVPVSNRVVVGGDFHYAGNCQGSGIPVDNLGGNVDSGFDPVGGSVNGTVYAVEADGSGGWYIGGDFTDVGGTARKNLAHLNPDGSNDATFLSGLTFNGAVRALSLYSGTLYVGGQFKQAQTGAGVPVDTTTGLTTLPGSFFNNPGFPQGVSAVVSDGSGGWFVGGSFWAYQSQTIYNLAHIYADGSLDTGFTPNPDESVRSLYLSGGTLYVGGTFANIAGIHRPNLAALSATLGTATSFSSGLVGTPMGLTVAGGNLIAGGDIYSAGANESLIGSAGVWVSNSTAALQTGFPRVEGGYVNASASDGSGGWFIGGSFKTVGGLARAGLAHVASNGSVTSWNPGVSYANYSGGVQKILRAGTTLYVAGSFEIIGGTARSNIAAVDTSTGAVSSWNPNITGGGVNTMVIDGALMYVGGDFTSIGGSARSQLGVIQLSDGSVTAWDAGTILVSGSSPSISAIAVSSSTVYVGGVFDSINGQPRASLAALNKSTAAVFSWDPNGTPGNSYAYLTVSSLILYNSTLYVLGGFNSLGGASRTAIAAIDPATGLDTGWDPHTVQASTYGATGVLSGSTLYAVGMIEESSGHRGAVAYNLTTGNTLAWEPSMAIWNGSNGGGGWIDSDGTNVLIGGYYLAVGGAYRTNLASFNPSTGAPTSWAPNVTSAGYSYDHYNFQSDGTTLFVSGPFIKINNQNRNYLASFTLSNGALTAWDPSPDDKVWRMALSGSSLYVGGDFLSIGGQSRSYLAEISTSTGLASSWNPNPNSRVTAVAADGSKVYVGGGFQTIGGQSRSFIASLDPTTGNATSWNPNADGLVTSISIAGSTAYIAGNFTAVGAPGRRYAAAFNAITGAVLPWHPDPSGQDDEFGVFAISATASQVYLGGYFQAAGGQPRTSAAAVDPTTGIANSWRADIPGGYVNAIAVKGSTVYLGGNFNQVNVDTRNRIAAVDATTGNTIAWDPSADAPINGLAVSSDGSTVYAAGDFQNIGGQTRYGLAAIDSASALATSWDPTPGIEWHQRRRINTVKLSGSTAYIGGAFGSMGGSGRANVAEVSLTTGAVTSWDPGARGEVKAIAVGGSRVYLGGSLTFVGGQTRYGLAALDTAYGSLTDWDPNAAGGAVNSMAFYNGYIYVAGDFTLINSVARAGLAAVSASTGATLSSWNPSPDDSVSTVAVNNSVIYVGGRFQNIGGQPRSRIASLNPTTGNATSWNPNADWVVDRIVATPSAVFVGGGFSTIGGQTRNRLAALNPTTGLATAWDAHPGSSPGFYAMVVQGTRLYLGGEIYAIGGYFNPIGGNNAVALDVSTGVAQAWDPMPLSAVYSIATNPSGTTVFLGGSFVYGFGWPPTGFRRFIAAVDATTGIVSAWNPSGNEIDAGNPSGATAIAADSSNVYIGGTFNSMGGKSHSGICAVDATTGLSVWGEIPH